MTYSCPLCLSHGTYLYFIDKQRVYNQCGSCSLVFVTKPYLPSLSQEKSEYELHENDLNQSGYRAFLTRSLHALIDTLASTSESLQTIRGLDFGSGPNPCFQELCSEQNLSCVSYDPIFAPHHELIQDVEYDFITATEVVEHLHNPHFEFSRLVSLLRPNGVLLVMTKRVESQQRFGQWHYKNDPTHVCFYTFATFEFIAAYYGLTLQIVSDDIVILRKASN